MMMTDSARDAEKTIASSRNDGVTIWRRIADEIAAGISRGGLQPGAKLPTEAELALSFGVNRHTVRRALASLAQEGIVRSSQGRGSFVERPRIPYPIGPRTRFSEILAAEGHVAGGELISAEEAAADERAASALGLKTGSPVLRIELKRFSDGVAVSVSVSHLPLPRFAGFAEAFRNLKTVTAALAECGVTDYRRIETRVGARLATNDEAAQLSLDADPIVLRVDSINVDPEGAPIQHTTALFAASRIELVIGEGSRVQT